MAAEPRYLLDTNICIFILDAAIPQLRHRIEQMDEGALATSTIVLAELLLGTDIDSPAATQRLQSLLAVVPALPFDDTAARAYARLPFRRGRFDRLIAAHALSLGLAVVTANIRDFADVPGLQVEDWTQG
nr:type II toxin-antitoxin system VapC family toxin [Polymorphobacter sp.]